MFVLLVWSGHRSATAQIIEDAVFWEVTGKDLTQPSYLFGTYHLIGNRYVDSLDLVMKSFRESKTIVSEMLLDSAMSMAVMQASIMKNTTLDKLLSPTVYAATQSWLKELSGFDLRAFNQMNPITVQIFILTLLQQKNHPLGQDVPMDLYFQQQGKQSGKKVLGLEKLQDQIYALYEQFSLERQAELLTAFVLEKEKSKEDIVRMEKLYRAGALHQLEQEGLSVHYTAAEMAVMTDDRNLKWVKVLPGLFREQSTFVAVGAFHLVGKTGLVHQLRQLGYVVRPLPRRSP